MEAALDTMVDSRHVDLTLLVQDEKGVVSEQFGGGKTKAVSDPEQARKKADMSLFHKIAHSECEVSSKLVFLIFKTYCDDELFLFCRL